MSALSDDSPAGERIARERTHGALRESRQALLEGGLLGRAPVARLITGAARTSRRRRSPPFGGRRPATAATGLRLGSPAIARNAAADALRARRLTTVAQAPGPAGAPTAAELEAFAVHAARSTLPERERAVIELAYFSGLSQSEVVRFTGPAAARHRQDAHAQPASPGWGGAALPGAGGAVSDERRIREVEEMLRAAGAPEDPPANLRDVARDAARDRRTSFACARSFGRTTASPGCRWPRRCCSPPAWRPW